MILTLIFGLIMIALMVKVVKLAFSLVKIGWGMIVLFFKVIFLPITLTVAGIKLIIWIVRKIRAFIESKAYNIEETDSELYTIEEPAAPVVEKKIKRKESVVYAEPEYKITYFDNPNFASITVA